MIKPIISVVVVLPLFLAACEGRNGSGYTEYQSQESLISADENKVPRQMDVMQIARGATLFKESCAECHGENAEGASTWRERGEDGYYLAPPLNGSGHTWHYSAQMLREVIKNGSPAGKGKMPAWKERLSDQQIEDIIAWFQSRWPDEQYLAWLDIDQRNYKRATP